MQTAFAIGFDPSRFLRVRTASQPHESKLYRLLSAMCAHCAEAFAQRAALRPHRRP